MTRLPTVGGDTETWGTTLNDYLTKTAAVFALNGAVAEGATSFTLSTAPPMAAHQGWFLIDPWTTSAELWRPTSISGATVTCATASEEVLTASNISFTSGTKRIAGSSEAISKFFPGEKITVAGSASNNGTYTVAAYPTDGTYDGTYITVVESLVTESAGASVTITRRRRAHSDGAVVIFVDGLVIATWYGAKASQDTSHAAANRAAFQRCLDDAYYAHANEIYVPGFMGGRYYIDAPLYLEKLTHLRGPHHKSAVLAASTGFCRNEDVAMLVTRRNGLPCRWPNGGNDRYYVTGIGLDGGWHRYAGSTNFDINEPTGTAYCQSGTKIVSIHATLPSVGNGITYRALAGGTGGNALRIAHVNDGASQPLTVTASGNDITVHLATNGSSVVTSTLADVVAAVNADPDSNGLVQAHLQNGFEIGVTGADQNRIATTFAMTALWAGTAPFAAEDVGRSLCLATGGVSRGAGEGYRTITGFTNSSTVTVGGDNFLKSFTGMRFAVSPINGCLGAYNQTSVWTDIRIESCAGYGFGASGSQEYSVRNMMLIDCGTAMRLNEMQFAHFIDMNFEGAMDAYVSFEAPDGASINRSNHFIGGHIEDSTFCDYFRINTPNNKAGNNWILEYQATASTFSTVFYQNTLLKGSYGILGFEWSGPNDGPLFVNDADRSLSLPMTDYNDLNSFTVMSFVMGGKGGATTTMGLQSVNWASTITPNAGVNSPYSINVNNTGAFTIANPTNPLFTGQVLQFEIKNNSGGAMGAVTWGAQYKLAGAFTNPANTLRRTIAFQWDGTNWIETSRAAADI